MKKTHKVLDLTYTPEEGQDDFIGTEEECNDYVAEQSDFFMYQVVPMTKLEIEVWHSMNQSTIHTELDKESIEMNNKLA